MLLDLEKLIVRLKAQIRFSGKELKALIKDNRNSAFCLVADELLDTYGNPQDALKKAGKKLLTHGDDYIVYCDMVDGLGTSNLESQISHLTLYSQLINEQLAEARKIMSDKAKLYPSIGLFVGVAISMLVF